MFQANPGVLSQRDTTGTPAAIWNEEDSADCDSTNDLTAWRCLGYTVDSPHQSERPIRIRIRIGPNGSWASAAVPRHTSAIQKTATVNPVDCPSEAGRQWAARTLAFFPLTIDLCRRKQTWLGEWRSAMRQIRSDWFLPADSHPLLSSLRGAELSRLWVYWV